MSLPQIDPVTAAITDLASRVRTVDCELLPLARVCGRILSEPLLADRDSPALNVSAMDGYALRISDARSLNLPVCGVATAGSPAPNCPAGAAVRIFTGAPVPLECDCVIPREQTIESAEKVTISEETLSKLSQGQHIRLRGENASQGSVVLSQGTFLNPSAMSAIASFASAEIGVYKRLRVAIVNTGDELIAPGHAVQDWQIRDSNGPTLGSIVSRQPWLELASRTRVADQLDVIIERLEGLLPGVDAILLTGGVSMGDTDHVPAAIQAVGGQIVFHRLPIRPGKPVLGAVTPSGQLLIGLPGNPVSVAVTATAIALPILRRMAGLSSWLSHAPRTMIEGADDRSLPLQWYRLVQWTQDGRLEYADSRGSGDLISLAQSVGYVTIPAHASGPGPWPLTQW